MKITLKKDIHAKCWIARHTGEGSGVIHELFGTNELPTPFTCNADANTVLEQIKRLNPFADVVLA